MPHNKQIKQKPAKAKAKETESSDSAIEALIEQIQLRNDALKKIYDFFGKETNKDK